MTQIKENNKVVLGLSGGVDSTAAALLLKDKGFDVTGLFFDVLGHQETEADRARQAAKEIGIPFVYRNAAAEFSDSVISYFCRSYEQGRTPNPCVFCNPTVKFKILTEEADRVGAFYIATGHYARVAKDKASGLSYIHQGTNLKKDQSYMLYRLGQSVLKRLILPLGMYESKEEVRELVRENHIHNADAKDSQEICFIKEGNYIDYLIKHGHRCKSGKFVDTNGMDLGQHQGLIHYTVGQRKGLGVTFGKPMFVIGMDAEKNQVVLGENHQLFTDTVYAEDCSFSITEGVSSLPEEYDGIRVTAKIRYAAKPAEAVVRKYGDGISVIFKEKQRAATPGQSVVLYDGSRLLGGGFIK